MEKYNKYWLSEERRRCILGKKKRNIETLIKGMHKARKSKFDEAGAIVRDISHKSYRLVQEFENDEEECARRREGEV